MLLLSPIAARAQGETDRAAIARTLFQEGVELARGERYTDAVDRFRRAYELRPAPAIAFNLASALTHLGELVEAAEILHRVQRAPEVTGDLRAAVDVQLEAITPRIGRLRIRLDGDARDVRVELDDEELSAAVLGIEVPTDPGLHVARAVRGGDEVARGQTQIAEGASGEILLTIPERAAEIAIAMPTEPVRDAPVSEQGDDTWIWVGLGIGIAVAGAAAITAVVLLQPGASPEPIMGNTMPGVIEW